uniref:Uncharacterized protein n=1 Tax=uncultured Poseidoniia archaeon TaxID=1697135 RepID=A0A1B1T9N3_9ARCH|nr:hypothetical protein [uncultured Candidatus Thalassoarchaea sp.]
MPRILNVPNKTLDKINDKISEDDIDKFLLECLDIGLNAVNQATTGIDFSVVERGFETFSLELNRKLLGDKSELAMSIRDHFTNSDSPFRKALDPNNEGGPVGKFVKEHQKAQEKINQGYEDIQSDLIDNIGEQFKQIKAAMDYEGIMKRKEEELDAKDKESTQKGVKFESEIESYLATKISNNDSVVPTGMKSESGSSRKVGDLGISVTADDGTQYDIAIEAKSGKFYMDGKESLLLQLNEAMEIRKAKGGIAVADVDYAGIKHTDAVRRVGRNRYVVLVDRKNMDFGPVETMYWALREAIYLDSKDDSSDISIEDITTHVQGIANEISIIQAMKKNLTDATNNICVERDKLGTMSKNITWRLGELKNLGSRKTASESDE